MVLAPTLGRYFAARSAVMFQVGTPETLWKGPIPMVLALMGALVYTIPFAVLAIRASEPLFGATPGQRLLGLEVALVPGSGPARGPSAAARLGRYLLLHLGFLGFLLGLVFGRWELAALGLVAALLRGAARLAGVAAVDRWTGTRLVRTAPGPEALRSDSPQNS